MLAWALVFLLLTPAALGQKPKEPRLPGGKSRNLAILKADFERSKKDIAEILRLAKELQEEVEKNEEFVIDLRSVRKTERLERLSRNVKNRMKRLQ